MTSLMNKIYNRTLSSKRLFFLVFLCCFQFFSQNFYNCFLCSSLQLGNIVFYLLFQVPVYFLGQYINVIRGVCRQLTFDNVNTHISIRWWLQWIFIFHNTFL